MGSKNNQIVDFHEISKVYLNWCLLHIVKNKDELRYKTQVGLFS